MERYTIYGPFFLLLHITRKMEDRERLDVSLCLFIIYYFFVFFAITACGKTVIINKILDKK